MTAALPLVALLAQVLAPPQTPAPQQAPASVQSPSADQRITLPARVGVDPTKPQTLTLEDAISMTLEQNNDVSIAKLDVAAADEDIHAANGVYDTTFVPSLSYQRTVSASASAIGGAVNGRLQQNQLAGTMELAKRSPWGGGQFTFDFTSARLESSNQFARLNPQFPSSLGGTLVQPLARGRGFDSQRRDILLARRAADLTDSQLRQVIMEQLTLVEQAYWDLVFAARNLDVQVGALQQAQTQVASNERQVQAGTLAPIDVVEAETQVANFRQSAASAQQALTQAENRLKALMLAARGAEIWNQPLVPAEPVDRTVPELSLDDAVKLALTRRPELTVVDTRRAENDVQRRFFRDQAKPAVNLVGTYTLSGLAGGALLASAAAVPGSTSASDAALLARLNQLSVLAGLSPLDTPPPSSGSTVPPFLVGSYSSSLSNLFAWRYPTALVQLQVELPLANTTAKANIAKTDILDRQIARQRQQLEQAIEVEVRNAMQAVQTSQQRLDASASARRNAAEQYESERRRFDSGLSTVFLVLERQTALVNAQGEELRARADLNQAVAELDRSIGGTLERYGVQMQTSER